MGQNRREQSRSAGQQKDRAICLPKCRYDRLEGSGHGQFHGHGPIAGYEADDYQTSMADQRRTEPPARPINQQHNKDEAQVPKEGRLVDQQVDQRSLRGARDLQAVEDFLVQIPEEHRTWEVGEEESRRFGQCDDRQGNERPRGLDGKEMSHRLCLKCAFVWSASL